MAAPLPPATRRLVGLLCMLSGAMLALGLGLRVFVGVYTWNTVGSQSSAALMLSFNLLGLLASGLLVRYGLRMRRGNNLPDDPNRKSML